MLENVPVEYDEAAEEEEDEEEAEAEEPCVSAIQLMGGNGESWVSAHAGPEWDWKGGRGHAGVGCRGGEC